MPSGEKKMREIHHIWEAWWSLFLKQTFWKLAGRLLKGNCPGKEPAKYVSLSSETDIWIQLVWDKGAAVAQEAKGLSSEWNIGGSICNTHSLHVKVYLGEILNTEIATEGIAMVVLDDMWMVVCPDEQKSNGSLCQWCANVAWKTFTI